ncbi:Elicitor-responsive protein [Thalictrum thalictroides]|uniref:Elicitor-responsive protein n=1 Tax=Thalictrum thalictroides TaxID=46969 RepID=A0A7J6V5K5_THATH|nr:Elicitor-responsive protein [Thalictrum thalictroides]
MKEMREGILEVLLVSAEGIRKKNFIGKPNYYVVIQCGDQSYKSKITPGKDKKALWNEKFTFKFTNSNCWQDMTHLKLKIMDEEKFSEGKFIGETTLHLGGVLTEGNEKGCIELKPTPYNVVLEDDTYKGEIKVGLKFVSNVEMQTKTRDFITDEKQAPWSICEKLYNFLRIPHWKIFFSYYGASPLTMKKQE